MASVLNIPMPFLGTAEEVQQNQRTHLWQQWGDPEEIPRCAACDCKRTHVASRYPCGTEPPRITLFRRHVGEQLSFLDALLRSGNDPLSASISASTCGLGDDLIRPWSGCLIIPDALVTAIRTSVRAVY